MHEVLKRLEKSLSSWLDGPTTMLVAVSGGIDSITLLDALCRSDRSAFLPLRVEVVHCNFSLRGEESDGDESFVRQMAAARGLECHVRRFDTLGVARARGISIQMAARDLRYAYFEELRERMGGAYVLVAHQEDDRIETFFINLFRGTGYKGLQGIPATRDWILRPFWDVSRADIADYARQFHLSYREDSSNGSDKYLRNRIRHHLVPLLEALDPHARAGILVTMEHLLDLDRRSLPELALWQSYGFSSAVIREAGLRHRTGRRFLSATHEAVWQRDHWEFERREPECLEPFVLTMDATSLLGVHDLPGGHTLEVEEWSGSEAVDRSAGVLYLEASRMVYPLRVRVWQSGDRLQPFGMRGRKKVSDLLVDAKVCLLEKRRVYILEMGGEIVWVLGYRAGESTRREAAGFSRTPVYRFSWK